MTQESAVSDANIFPYMLSVSTRDGNDGDDSVTILDDLTYRTIVTWHTIVGYLEKGVYKYTGGSVEDAYVDEINKRMSDIDRSTEEPFELEEPFGKSRVEVWATFRGEKNPFHLCSDDNPQTAINVWLGHNRGIKRAIEKLVPKQPETTPQAAQNSNTTQISAYEVTDVAAFKAAMDAGFAAAKSGKNPMNAAMVGMVAASKPIASTAHQNAANANVAPVEGVLVANTWPDKKKVQYADGQLVSFTITKIKAAFFKGSPTYELYTSFGGNYPGFTVYKFKTGTQELTQTYESVVGVLATLNLTLEQPERVGTWRAVVKANHSEKDGSVREYLNVQNLTAV